MNLKLKEFMKASNMKGMLTIFQLMKGQTLIIFTANVAFSSNFPRMRNWNGQLAFCVPLWKRLIFCHILIEHGIDWIILIWKFLLFLKDFSTIVHDGSVVFTVVIIVMMKLLFFVNHWHFFFFQLRRLLWGKVWR